MSTIDKKKFEEDVRIFLQNEIGYASHINTEDITEDMSFLVFVLQKIGKHSRWSIGQGDLDLPFSSLVNYECKIWSVGAFYGGSLPEACIKGINEFVKIYNHQKQNKFKK